MCLVKNNWTTQWIQMFQKSWEDRWRMASVFFFKFIRFMFFYCITQLHRSTVYGECSGGDFTMDPPFIFPAEPAVDILGNFSSINFHGWLLIANY